jgi:signal peptidase I
LTRSTRAALEILAALFTAFFIKVFLFDVLIIEGRSMEGTLRDGSFVVVNRLSYGLRNPFAGRYMAHWAEPEKNDIIVFYTPYGELAVKRCSEVFESGGVTLFWVEGDNRDYSYDSRTYGPVSADNIVGKVMWKK